MAKPRTANPLPRALLDLAGVAMLAWAALRLGDEQLALLDWQQRVWWQLAALCVPLMLMGLFRGRVLTRRAWGLNPVDTRRARVSVLLTLAIGLLLSGYLVRTQMVESHRLAQSRFDNQVRLLRDELQQRFGSLLQGLRGIRALHASRGSLSREEFHRYIDARNLPVEFPGVRGFGFVERVETAALEDFTRRQRADGTRFQLRGLGKGNEHFIIRYIEPQDRNEAALGLDLSAEPVRRSAVEKAVREGRPVLSGALTLVQDGQSRHGYLLLLPIYRGGQLPDGEPERRAALQGLVHAPLVLAELLDEIEPVLAGMLDFEVYDRDREGKELLVHDYDSHSTIASGGHDHQRPKAYLKHIELPLLDRALTLHVEATPAFMREIDDGQALRTGLGGIALSALLGAVVWLMLIGRLRARQLAANITRDLQISTQRAEAAVSENKLLMLSLNLHCLVSMTDRYGRFTYVNDGFCSVSGYGRAELLGQSHRVTSSGVHSPEFWKEVWSTISTGKSWTGEICNRSKSGVLYWAKTTITPALDSHGEVDRYVALHTDITQQHENEQQLQQLNERLELALQGGNSGLWDWLDTHEDRMWWSPQLYRMLGYTAEELPATVAAFDRQLHPDDQPLAMRALELALRGLRPYDEEFRLRIKDGSYRWFRSRAQVFRDDKNEHQRMAGSLQDIHDLKLNQAALRDQGERMAGIFALSPDGFAAIDAEQRISYASATFVELCGLPAERLQGISIQTLLQTLAEQGDAQPLPTLERLDQEALQLNLQQPHPRVLRLALHRSGEGLAGMLQLRDITQQFELDRMKSEFLATAAHELRTPMVSIYGFAELLLHREMPPDRQKNYLGKIHRQCKAMMNVTTELLDLARLEARRGEDFVYERVELPALIDETVQDFQVPEGREAPALDWDGAARWPVKADRSKLRQVLGNLLSNAYKYSPGGGPVSIRLRSHLHDGMETLSLSVSDAGMGMTPEQLARVTERFYRADPSGHVLGSGLGMSIVKEIVELHQGRLQLQSEAGVGTTVTVLLPLDND
ncbi:CHASE domain-containing protein [Paucibacter sp. APW11]|uniref:histidine kinase n=1 Tax=Roseateles aquae TaxID=3077235 RepID=A0ABU3PGI8_9BURK|nr:CHASE domain-containing protein [Paucibacter sp. APW11]MDT9001710.1 CHASE domain-containing protein [Paucibacter sp. APW11]